MANRKKYDAAVVKTVYLSTWSKHELDKIKSPVMGTGQYIELLLKSRNGNGELIKLIQDKDKEIIELRTKLKSLSTLTEKPNTIDATEQAKISLYEKLRITEMIDRMGYNLNFQSISNKNIEIFPKASAAREWILKEYRRRKITT